MITNQAEFDRLIEERRQEVERKAKYIRYRNNIIRVTLLVLLFSVWARAYAACQPGPWLVALELVAVVTGFVVGARCRRGRRNSLVTAMVGAASSYVASFLFSWYVRVCVCVCVCVCKVSEL